MYTLYVFCYAGDIKVIDGEGMPIYKNPIEKGNLFVKFKVIFPPNNFAIPENLKVFNPIVFLFCLKYVLLYPV